MKKLFTGVLALGIAGQLMAKPWVQPELEETLKNNSNSHFTVIAKFRTVGAPISLQGLTPSEIIQSKQRQAALAMDDLLDTIEVQQKRSSDIKRISKFWIDNSMAITATPAFLRTLKDREDLARLELNETIKLFDPMETTNENSDSETLTYGVKKVRAAKVWDELGIDGTGVTVGVLDTGIDSDHADLAGRVIKSKDFVSDYEDDTANDGHGHGTHCAGSIGGAATSGIAIGVAPKVNFLGGKIFSDSGSTTREAIMNGMQWMTDPDGDPETDDFPRVVSNSWGGPLGTHWVEIMNTWHAMGIAPVFAAGNSGPRPGTVGAPGAYKESITIGATDSQDKIARFSSRGPVTFQGETYIKPDVSAPGVNVYSAKNGGGYQKMSGTSMATPHVAGIVALMLQADPDLPVERIRDILHETSVDLGDPGMDNIYGMGRVDAYEAVKLVLTGGKAIVSVDSGDQDATIKINPGNKIVKASDGIAKLSLAEGSYTLEISAFGYFSKTVSVDIVAKEVKELSLSLEQAPTFTATFNVANSGGAPLAANLSFVDVPVEGGDTSEGSLTVDLPGGAYTVVAKSRGYQPKTIDINVTDNQSFDLVMDSLPPYVLVDDDKGKNYETYYTAALDEAGIEYDFKNKTLSSDDLMGYANVIWFTGSASNDTLSSKEQAALKAYVNSGGRLILTGQDIGYNIKNTSFYKEVVGVKYLKDTSKIKTVTGQNLEFRLDGLDSANNQKYPDVVELNGAETLFTYKGQGPAGTLNTYGEGKVAYLAFGFEGIKGASSRDAVLAVLLESVKASNSELLDRIHWAFKKDRELHAVLVRNFEVSDENRDEVESYLSNAESKSAFRSIISSLKQLQ
ncbi:MAG: S8 family serine peptidase [bacterium]|nr:S8 family serine peptidase [bacterium]